MSLSGWCVFLGWFALEMAALVAGALLLQSCFRTPRARRVLWQAAFTSMALACIVEFSGARERMAGLNFKARHRFAVTATVLPASASQAGAPQVSAREVVAAAAPAPKAVKWPGWVWLAGGMLLLARSLAARVWLGLRGRSARPADADSLQSISWLQTSLGLRRVRAQVWAGLQSPVAFGLGRPTIALPPDFSTRFSSAERQAVLAHEMAHLAAHDPAWLLISDVVIALAWWHPLIWWARRKLQIATETAADEASALVPGGPCALAECLVRLGREMTGLNPARTLGFGGNGLKSQLAARIVRLLREPGAWRPASAWARWMPQLSAALVALTSVLLPIQTGLSGSVFAVLCAAAPVRAEALPIPLAPITATNQVAEAAGAPTLPIIRATHHASAPPRPHVKLAVEFVMLREMDSDGIGLDWLFGAAPTNDVAMETSHDWSILRQNIPPGIHPPRPELKAPKNENHPRTVAVDILKTGRTVILNPGQFAALRERIMAATKADIVAAPKAVCESGNRVQIAIQESETIVTGVEASGDSGAGAGVNYYTDGVLTGPSIDLVASAEKDGAWHLTVGAQILNFQGYDKPGVQPSISQPGGKPLKYVTPLPHFRLLEAISEASAPSGSTMAIRGPLETTVTKTKGHLFTRAKSNTLRQRLYVFVTPTALPSADDRP